MNNPQISTDLPNGTKLVAEVSRNPNCPYELYVGIKNKHGVWIQDLAIVRSSDDEGDTWNDGTCEVLVYGDGFSEDYTNKFKIDLYKEEE